MRIGYARVSTDEQTPEAQVQALRAAGCTVVFVDQGISGTKTARQGLAKALEAMVRGDVLVVWKLDRLGRSLKFLIDTIERLHGTGCGFASLTEGFDTTTSAGKLVCHILAAIAEFERALIAERTRAGLAVARRSGKKIGRRHRLSDEVIAEAHRLVSVDRHSVAHVARELGVSYDTLRRGFRRFGLVA